MVATEGEKRASVLVVGGGITGATVAERLARAGAAVHLVEKQPDIGGRVAQMGCKATDVCVRCNVCVGDEILRSVRNVPAIHIYTSAQLHDLQRGRNGRRYRARLTHFDAGSAEDKPSAVDVDAVVIATGHEPYNPVENSSYGYGRLPNVITGAEAEEQLAQTRRIARVSDGRTPKRIAFIQCVGSRTDEVFREPADTSYCSKVCCAYALRMARQMKHQAEDSDVTVFYMDIQHFGKGFDQFYRECKERMRFVRSRPYEFSAGADGAVRVTYTEPDGGENDRRAVCKEEFDLVILAVGIRPPADAEALAARLGVATDEQGFFGLKGAGAFPDLQREGIFAAGTSEGPKDIVDSVAQAQAVSAAILAEIAADGAAV